MKILFSLLFVATSMMGFAQNPTASYPLQVSDNVSFDLECTPVIRKGKKFYSCRLTVVNASGVAVKRSDVNDDDFVRLELSRQNQNSGNWGSSSVNFSFKNETKELKSLETVILYELYDCTVPPVLLNKKFHVGYEPI